MCCPDYAEMFETSDGGSIDYGYFVPEWVAVGLLGQIRVRDDGTCKVGRYCLPNDEGIATASKKGYKIIKRTQKNQIIILFR